MGNAVRRPLAAAGGGLVGGLAGVVAGGYIGASSGIKIGYKRAAAGSESPKEEQPVIETDDLTTAICAALSSWVYHAGDRAVWFKVTTRTWLSVKGMEDETEDDFFNEQRPGPDLLHAVVATGFSEKLNRRWVKIKLGTMEVFVWQDDAQMEFVTTVSKDITTEIGQLLTSERGRQLIARSSDVKRAVWLPGGLLLPSALSVVIHDDANDEATLYIAWQGTMFAERPIDLCTDLGAAPVNSLLWHEQYPNILAHSAIYAKVQGDVARHTEGLLKDVIPTYLFGSEEKTHKRMIFTGHSLGGGCARVAHMCAHAIFEGLSEGDTKTRCNSMSLMSITFAAPMVLYLRPSDGDSTDDVKAIKLQDLFHRQSVNHIFDKDVVPRLPGDPKFYKQAIHQALLTGVRSLMHDMTGSLVSEQAQVLAKRFATTFLDSGSMESTFAELKHYQSFAAILFYAYDTTDDTLHRRLIEDGDMKQLPDTFDGPNDNWQALLQCHSALPKLLKISRAKSFMEWTG